MATVALAVSKDEFASDVGNAVLVPALASHGIESRSVVWDSGVDWDAFDLVVVRAVLDYSARREEFLDWARSVPRLLNPASVLTWNSDKHYLEDLEAAGVPVVPTTWLEPTQHLNARGLHTRFPSLGDFVIKPAIGAGAQDTGRYTSVDAWSRGLAIDHARWLLAEGRSVLVQRYVRSVDVAGERALFFIDGAFSHALHKQAMLTQPGAEARSEELVQVTDVTDQDRATGSAALEAALRVLGMPDQPLLYGRVDLITGDGGEPLVLELELVKSQMHTELVPEAADQFAAAIARRLG